MKYLFLVSGKVTARHTSPGRFSNVLPGHIVIFKPNNKQIDELISINDLVNDPKFTSLNIPRVFIYRALGSGGCQLSNFGKGAEEMCWSKIDWPGGWVDQCRPGAWDYAGRVIAGVNSPSNYEVDNLWPISYKIESEEIHFYPLIIE